MSVSLNLQGLRQLAKSLEQLPDALAEQAAAQVRQSAVETASELRDALAKGPTGNLKRRVRLQRRDPLVWQVISGAPHAFINEEGTTVRQTKSGANRGVSPARKTVARVASRKRREMDRELERVLVQVLGTVR
jgi:HPt (histidine-containing phosphotransfer) domain-containing protein